MSSLPFSFLRILTGRIYLRGAVHRARFFCAVNSLTLSAYENNSPLSYRRGHYSERPSLISSDFFGRGSKGQLLSKSIQTVVHH